MKKARKYTLTVARIARKELESIDAALVPGLYNKIIALADNPRPAGCRKIHSERSLWRIRAGQYRIIYKIDDANRIVDIAAVRHRSDAYR